MTAVDEIIAQYPKRKLTFKELFERGLSIEQSLRKDGLYEREKSQREVTADQ